MPMRTVLISAALNTAFIMLAACTVTAAAFATAPAVRAQQTQPTEPLTVSALGLSPVTLLAARGGPVLYRAVQRGWRAP
jgi:hypothetical protein